MTPEQFAYWLQGFAELSPQAPTAEQWQAIRDHLNLVFKKETPVVVAPFRVGEGEKSLKDCIGKWQILPDFTKPPTITC